MLLEKSRRGRREDGARGQFQETAGCPLRNAARRQASALLRGDGPELLFAMVLAGGEGEGQTVAKQSGRSPASRMKRPSLLALEQSRPCGEPLRGALRGYIPAGMGSAAQRRREGKGLSPT